MSIYRLSFSVLLLLPFLAQAGQNLVAATGSPEKTQLNIKPYVRELSQDEKNRIAAALVPANARTLASNANLKPPTWAFSTGSNVDPLIYNNVLIGGDPQLGGRTDVKLVIVPITFKFHSYAKGIDLNTGAFITEKRMLQSV